MKQTSMEVKNAIMFEDVKRNSASERLPLVSDDPLETPRTRAANQAPWQSILDIAERIKDLTLDTDYKKIVVDESVFPVLPTNEECAYRFKGSLNLAASPETVERFVSRCAVLKNQLEQGYRSSVASMGSLTHITGVQDKQLQMDRSIALERWFDKALDGIISACKGSSAGQQDYPGTNFEILSRAFHVNPCPNDKEREVMASASGLTYKQVTTWFQNRRQRSKSGPTAGTSEGSPRVDCAMKNPPVKTLIKTGRARAVASKAASDGTTSSGERTKSTYDAASRHSGTILRDKRVKGLQKSIEHRQSSHSTDEISRFSLEDERLNGDLPRRNVSQGTKRRTVRRTLKNKVNAPTKAFGNATEKHTGGVMERSASTESSMASNQGEPLTSRIPSLTRSVSTASTDSETPSFSVGPMPETRTRNLDARKQLSGLALQPNNSLSRPVSFRVHKGRSGPEHLRSDDTNGLAIPELFQPENDAAGRIKRMTAPLRSVRGQTELSLEAHQTRVIPAQFAQQPQTLPCNSNSPSSRDDILRQPDYFQLVTDHAGNQYLAPITSLIGLPHLTTPTPYRPQYQVPSTRYNEQEYDLRAVSSCTRLDSNSDRFETFSTPTPSVQSGTRLSTPDSSIEVTPSPYRTPQMQTKRTASMAITPAVVECTGAHAEESHRQASDIPLPAPTYEQAYPSATLSQDVVSVAQPRLEPVPDLSVDGVPFSFAELEAGNFVLDEETLRDMEALLGLDGSDSIIDSTITPESNTSQLETTEEKQNEGNNTDSKHVKHAETGETGTTSPTSNATVELAFGQDGAVGLTYASTPGPASGAIPAFALETAHDVHGFGSAVGPDYTQIQTSGPVPTEIPSSGYMAIGEADQGWKQTTGYATEQPGTIYPATLTSTSSAGSGETAFPPYIYYTETPYAQQPQYQVQPYMQVPMTMQTPMPMSVPMLMPTQTTMTTMPLPTPEPLGGWKYEWERGVLPFEGV